MSATEGFWPGEAPPATEEQDDVQEPEATVAEPEPLAWPQPHEEEPEAEAEPKAQASVAQPEPEAEEDEAEEEPEVVPIGHVPGEVDIPDGVAVLEGSPSGADRTVGIVVSRFNGEISNRLL
jgi:hypothetical protein